MLAPPIRTHMIHTIYIYDVETMGNPRIPKEFFDPAHQMAPFDDYLGSSIYDCACVQVARRPAISAGRG